ncbi:hypothetical protein F4604DRAFT_1679685 [Suillus subluteus]|nr:hypothetical protein F4604DRAFT_1679685 [Suillus subluteus]
MKLNMIFAGPKNGGKDEGSDEVVSTSQHHAMRIRGKTIGDVDPESSEGLGTFKAMKSGEKVMACEEGGRRRTQGVTRDSVTVQGDEIGRERRGHDRTNSHAVGKEASINRDPYNDELGSTNRRVRMQGKVKVKMKANQAYAI